jgi:hypothetical protein
MFFLLTSLLVKPISSGVPTMSSDVNGEHDMDKKPVLPPRPEVDDLPPFGYSLFFYIRSQNRKNTFLVLST